MDPETKVFQTGDGENGDPSLHCSWLIHPCDGRTDRQTDIIAMAKTRHSSSWCRA